MTFDSTRLSHAYITEGETANDLAMASLCSSLIGNKPCRSCIHCDKVKRGIHPDIINISRLDDKREILIDQIRAIKKDVFIMPNEAEKKVYIVNDADTMNHNAQNAFLQMLEEPPAHAVFILKAANPALFLPTVLSRCVDLKTQPDTVPDAENQAELQALCSDFTAALDDNLKLAKCMLKIEKLGRLEVSHFILLAKEQIVLSLHTDTHNKKLSDAERVLVKAEEMLRLNVSSGHIAGYICASFIQ